MDRSVIEDACSSEVTDRVISFVALKASSVIQCNPPPTPVFHLPTEYRRRVGGSQHHHLYPDMVFTPPTTPGTPGYNTPGAPCEITCPPPVTTGSALPSLIDFIARIVAKSKAQTPTLLATLVYLDRLQRRLPKTAKGMHCTCHRIFLAAFILAAKYTNDSSPKNKHWARYAAAFSLAEVNLMERQLLFLLDFDLRIEETDLVLQIRPLRDYETNAATSLTLHPLYSKVPSKRRKSVVEIHAPDSRVSAAGVRSARRFSVAANVPSSNVQSGGQVLFEPPLPAAQAPPRLRATTNVLVVTPTSLAIPPQNWYPTPCGSVESFCSSEGPLETSNLLNFENNALDVDVPLSEGRPQTLQSGSFPIQACLSFHQKPLLAGSACAQVMGLPFCGQS